MGDLQTIFQHWTLCITEIISSEISAAKSDYIVHCITLENTVLFINVLKYCTFPLIVNNLLHPIKYSLQKTIKSIYFSVCWFRPYYFASYNMKTGKICVQTFSEKIPNVFIAIPRIATFLYKDTLTEDICQFHSCLTQNFIMFQTFFNSSNFWIQELFSDV